MTEPFLVTPGGEPEPSAGGARAAWGTSAVNADSKVAQPVPSAAFSMRGVSFRYGPEPVLEGIDLDIAAGAQVGILGPNGAGKSTMLRLLAGILAPAKGRVFLGGLDLASIKSAHRARQIAFVPQGSRMAFDFSVMEIVLMGRSPRLGLLGIEGESDLKEARRALEFTDLLDFAERPMSSLSSGERQRVVIARALAQQAETLLLDEPTAFLDLGNQVRIHKILEDLNRERRTTVVFVSHDLNLAARHAARLIVLAKGRILADGPPEAVLTPATLRSAYGVEARIVPDPTSGVPTVFVVGPAAPGGAPPAPSPRSYP